MPVTEADVAHVRRAFETFNERYEALCAGDVEDYFLEFYTEDAVVENTDSFPVAGRYQGVAGYAKGFDESYGPYTDVRWTVESAEAVGERVVAVARAEGRRPDDFDLIELRLAFAYEMREGRIAHVDILLTHEKALELARSHG